jgi:pyruvate/2-oxoglutarate/acetoin dehydrogenase E1 component
LMHMNRRGFIGRAVGIVGMVPVVEVRAKDAGECMHATIRINAPMHYCTSDQYACMRRVLPDGENG